MLTIARQGTIEKYLSWNEAIGRTLFEGEFAAMPAYLHLEPAILSKVAEAAGREDADDPQASLVAAVGGTLALNQVGSPFLHHIDQAERWERKNREGYPPFLALLAVLVLAAQEMVADAEHAAHNYYSRLEDLLDLGDALWHRVRHHFPETVPLWQALNDWLDDWEGERGVPTAAILDRRVYVSFPLSQALVRATDRAKLHDAFVEYGLTPGRRLAAAEMRHYLDDWLTRQASGSRLGRLWESSEVKDRIVEIACAELAAWTGPAAGSADQQAGLTQRLRWAAELREGPLPSLDLYLTARADAASVDGRYKVIAPTDGPAEEAVSQCLDDLRLEPLEGCEMASLEPWSVIGVASLLAGALRIRRRASPVTELLHSPHPLLVLALDERDGWYREVSRAQLLESCLVLAHRDRAALVEGHLRTHARPGYQRFEPDALTGLPVGWVAFLGVTIVIPADEDSHKKVAALCPAPADALALTGGLRLGPNAWHVDAPPEVVVTLEQDASIELLAACRRKLSDDAEDAPLGRHASPAAVPLAGAGLEVGDYDLRASNSKGRLLAHASMRLRSADYPRPMSGHRLASMAHDLSNARGLITATRQAAVGPRATGATLHELRAPQLAPRLVLPRQPLAAAIERVSLPIVRLGRFDESLHAQSCATRGYHYWMCEPGMMGESTRTMKRMQCSGCQREEWTVNRGRIKHRRPLLRSAPAGAARPPRMRAAERHAGAVRPMLDTLLDAVSYVGAGSWDGFKVMVRSLSNDPMLAWQSAHTLSALGHIDLTLDERTFRIAGWQVAPSALVETGDGSWVLAGARSDHLVDTLQRTLADIMAEEEDGAPTVFRTPPLSHTEVAALAAGLASPLGGIVAVTPRFAERAAAALKPLTEVLPTLAEARIPSRGHELFDFDSGCWQPAGDIPRAGAYRVDLHGRLYGFATAEQARDARMRVSDVLTAKHLAAAAKGISLVGYDPASQLLLAPLGAELPGLLHRVAALSSGCAPQANRNAGLITYRGVDANIAAHIQRCLSIA